MRDTNKTYFTPLIIGTIISLAGWISIITSSDPYKANASIFILFFVTFFLSTSGIAAIIGLTLRKWIIGSLPDKNFEVSMRQGAMLGALITLMLILKVQHILYWWVIAPLILFLLLTELFINTNQRPNG